MMYRDFQDKQLSLLGSGTMCLPQGLDIPMLLHVYNELRVLPTVNAVMAVEALPAEKKPSACIGCGKCMTACPQGIHIPMMLGELTEAIAKLPTWEEICIRRAQIQKRDMERP